MCRCTYVDAYTYTYMICVYADTWQVQFRVWLLSAAKAVSCLRIFETFFDFVAPTFVRWKELLDHWDGRDAPAPLVRRAPCPDADKPSDGLAGKRFPSAGPDQEKLRTSEDQCSIHVKFLSNVSNHCQIGDAGNPWRSGIRLGSKSTWCLTRRDASMLAIRVIHVIRRHCDQSTSVNPTSLRPCDLG